MKARRGFTIVEVMVASLLALMVIGLALGMLKMAGTVFHRVSGHEDGALQIKRAARNMDRDFHSTFMGNVRVEPVPGPAGFFGDGIAALSAEEQGRGPMALEVSGSPYWQRNIIYYLAVPIGDPCTLGANADGYEDQCPHKVLIRKVLDTGPTTLSHRENAAADPPNDEEELVPALLPYLTRPTGFTVSGMYAETPGVVQNVDIVATNLLTMRVRLNPAANSPGEIEITLQAHSEEAARETKRAGPQPLSDHKNTMTHILSIFPKNIQ